MKTAAICFGENLKKLRSERGLTQGEFAKKAGLSLSFVQLIEKGKKWVGPNTVTTIARTLRVPEVRLFADGEAASTPDPQQILFLVGQALGLAVTHETMRKVRVRTPLSAYASLFDRMPEDLGRAFTEKCQQPEWDWEKFRHFLG